MADRVALAVSPHPDDELLGAPATLMALRDAGWRVVNLACSLGRPDDRERRRAELAEACRRAGFELLIPEGLPPIGADDDRALAQRALADVVSATGADLLVAPSPHDGHHGHEVVGRAVRDAVEASGNATHVFFWGLWGELPLPNVIHLFGEERLREIRRALSAHVGELRRNRLDALLESRARMAAILGPERVFGFGIEGGESPYAELLTDATWSPRAGWTLPAARRLDTDDPLAGRGDRDIGWWLHAASVRSSL